jgi:L-aspartate oxidase
VPFDREPDGSLSLGLEGGHSRRRIVHAGGAATGARITERLTELVSEAEIDVLEGCSALALWSDGERCAGVLTDRGDLTAAATVLSTGGAAALWSRTTNPWGSIGAGSVLAHAAGATLADLELCQFHPTALALPGDPDRDGRLITEAVRGEGATLVNATGERFTDELAPRDAVTVAILDQMDADGADHVLLDLRGLDPERFPNIFETLREAGLDPTAEPVPVSPAAHYEMGGVATDLEGRTSLPGLYAVGEAACTGLHGANRLASNSLSECFVVGSRAARAAL